MSREEQRRDIEQIKRRARELIELPIVETATDDGTVVKPVRASHLVGAAKALETAYRIEADLPPDAPEPENFPASEAVPGQKESRTAYQVWEAEGEQYEWWADYLQIREQFPHFRNWRIYVYIAWAGSPEIDRDPATEVDLARDVLRCSDRTIRKWKTRQWADKAGEPQPNIEEAIAWVQAAPLLRHRRDVFEALVAVATMVDARAHPDRKLFLQMTGDFTPQSEVDLNTSGGVQIFLPPVEEALPSDSAPHEGEPGED